MEKEIKIGDKKFKIKEMKYHQVLKLPRDDPDKAARKQFELAVIEPKVTDEIFNELTAAEGLKLSMEINELSGLTKDFLSELGLT